MEEVGCWLSEVGYVRMAVKLNENSVRLRHCVLTICTLSKLNS